MTRTDATRTGATRPGATRTGAAGKEAAPEDADDEKDLFGRLDRFLDTLPLSATTKLFAAVEKRAAERGRAADHARDRDLEKATPGSGSARDADALDALPRERLIALLRRRIPSAEYFPARRADARRRFFEPFDAFFTAARKGRKRLARIPRTSLAPVWRFLTRSDNCPRAAAAAGRVSALIADPTDNGALATKAAADRGLVEALDHLYAAVVDDLSAVEARAGRDAGFFRAAAAWLGEGEGGEAGALVFDDLMEIARLCRIRDQLVAARARFPLGLKKLSDAGLRDAEALFMEAAAAHPRDAGYILMFFAGRMDQPWSAMPLYYRLRREPAAGALADLLFGDLEILVRDIERDGERGFEPRDAASRFERCAAFAEGIAAATRAAADGALTNRVEASRDLAATALARAVEQARAALRTATPVRQAHGSTLLFTPRPDVDVEACAELLDRAGRAAGFLADAPRLADALRRPWAAAGAEDAASYIGRYANDLVREIRAAEGDLRRRARDRFAALLDIASPLIEPGAAALLQERAAAAALAE
ncbi:MAG: hypothetical protein GC152_03515 [Alphaproteobacteria bacterium]|nr:hypothetical protein [Alphaproteobacteria bacterium]